MKTTDLKSPWLRRILVAVDRSANALAALLYGVALAEAHNASLTVMHVVDPQTAGGTAPLSLLAQRRHEISAIVDALPSRSERLDLRLTTGDACSAIVDEARRGRYNIVLVGERGETAESEVAGETTLALGRTAAALLSRLDAVLPVRSDLWGVTPTWQASATLS